MLLKLIMVACLTMASFAPAAWAGSRSEARTQVEFGIEVVQYGLWREAMYRWERAVELDPSYAAAWNNLAIAYEQMGWLEKARKAFEKAVVLEPRNSLIKSNYELFREINDRATRRHDR